MLKLMSSGDEDVDMMHLKLVAENIHAKACIIHVEFVTYIKLILKEVN